MSELLAIALLLAFAGWIASTSALLRGPSRRRAAAIVSLAWAATAAVLVGVALGNRNPEAPPPEPDVPLQMTDAEYRTSQTCESCHPEQYASWHLSYHRTMTQTASRASVIGDFDDVRLRFYGEDFRLFEQGGRYYGEMDDPFAQGSLRKGRVTVPLKQTTGSHHMQLYWYPAGAGRSLGVFPLVFLRDEQRWLPRRSVFITPPGPPPPSFGLWNLVCIECHTTHPRPRIRNDGGGSDSHLAELGIACEACHGPGGEHADLNRSPARRYRLHLSSDEDPTIVNPAELPHVRSTQVCGQCHVSKTLLGPSDATRWNIHGATFRPGDDLEESVNVISRANLQNPTIVRLLELNPDLLSGTFWSDGMIRVSGREYNDMVETACFQRGEMSCVSCHRLHQSLDDPREPRAWADDLLAVGMETSLACTQCHDSYLDETTLAAHTHHAPASSGSACMNCHMPYTTYGLLKAIRSHAVHSPTVRTELDAGRPNACNQCHLDRSLGWTAKTLARWYGQEIPALSDDQQRISAAVRWALEGDAGIRALAAWSMGWDAAQQTSGTSWLPPYLAELMRDPYDAVRIIAYRATKTLPGFENAAFGELDSPARREEAIGRILAQWASSAARGRGPDESTLIDSNGRLEADTVARLLEQRDTRPVSLLE